MLEEYPWDSALSSHMWDLGKAVSTLTFSTSSPTLQPNVFRQGLSVNMELTISASLDDQCASSFHDAPVSAHNTEYRQVW